MYFCSDYTETRGATERLMNQSTRQVWKIIFQSNVNYTSILIRWKKNLKCLNYLIVVLLTFGVQLSYTWPHCVLNFYIPLFYTFPRPRTILDAFIGGTKVIEKGIICYDFATPTKLSLSLFISVVPLEDVVLKWEIVKTHDIQLQISFTAKDFNYLWTYLYLKQLKYHHI